MILVNVYLEAMGFFIRWYHEAVFILIFLPISVLFWERF